MTYQGTSQQISDHPCTIKMPRLIFTTFISIVRNLLRLIRSDINKRHVQLFNLKLRFVLMMQTRVWYTTDADTTAKILLPWTLLPMDIAAADITADIGHYRCHFSSMSSVDYFCNIKIFSHYSHYSGPQLSLYFQSIFFKFKLDCLKLIFIRIALLTFDFSAKMSFRGGICNSSVPNKREGGFYKFDKQRRGGGALLGTAEYLQEGTPMRIHTS